jgi:hypothetical protein
MNANIPPLKIQIFSPYITDQSDGVEEGYAFAVQSFRGRCLQFHVLMQSGAHFRQIPLHYLWHNTPNDDTELELEMLQLWDCFSDKPTVTVFDFLRDYECNAILKDKTEMSASYWFTVDWLPDSHTESGVLLEPEQNKCAHVCLLANGQVCALPTNRIAFKDAYYIGNSPSAKTKGYTTMEGVHTAETCERWSVANTDKVYY